jgi:hypothetical protein
MALLNKCLNNNFRLSAVVPFGLCHLASGTKVLFVFSNLPLAMLASGAKATGKIKFNRNLCFPTKTHVILAADSLFYTVCCPETQIECYR